MIFVIRSSLFSILNTSISEYFRYRKVVFYVLEVEMCWSQLKYHSEMAAPPYINFKFQFELILQGNISTENNANVIKISER